MHNLLYLHLGDVFNSPLFLYNAHLSQCKRKNNQALFLVLVRNIFICIESRDSIPSRMDTYSLNVSLGRHLKQVCSSIRSESVFLHSSRLNGFYDGALVNNINSIARKLF